MIYLKNNKEVQVAYVPKEEDIHINPYGGDCTGAYQSGYSAGSQYGYEIGYEDGLIDGKDKQKRLLGHLDANENGDYSNPNSGWSSVTVNVPQNVTIEQNKEYSVTENGDYTIEPSNGYDVISAVSLNVNLDTESIYEEGFQSGVTNQKSLLDSIEITENGSYSAANGFSSVTVDVEPNLIEVNRTFRANTATTIMPPSYGIDYEYIGNRKIKITATGYTHSAYIGYVEDEYHQNYGYVDIYWDGNNIDYDDSQWNGERIYYTYTGNTTIMLDLDYTGASVWFEDEGDTGGTYDGISKVNVVVNVPQSGYTQQDLDDAYQSGITHQKSLLGSIEINENGSYSATNGYSAITVDVSQSGYTQQDLDDAYQSGITHQKSLLSSTTITTNGEYDSENGWNHLIVEVPQNMSVEENHTFSATSNGIFTITPSLGYDAMSSVTLYINTPQYSGSPYGELYCLWSEEGAEFCVASANGLTSVISLNSVQASVNGRYWGNADDGFNFKDADWYFFLDNDENKYRFEFSWGDPLLYVTSASSPYYNATTNFPDFYTVALRRLTNKVGMSVSPYSISGSTNSLNREISATSVNLGFEGYLKSANINNGICPLVPAIDQNGVACLTYDGVHYIYPRIGVCYPVFKNGDKYTIVKDIITINTN